LANQRRPKHGLASRRRRRLVDLFRGTEAVWAAVGAAISASGRPEVDLDIPDVRNLEPTHEGFGDDLDFSYDAYKEGLTYPNSGKIRLGRGESNVANRDECASHARSQPLANPEPIATIEVGNTLCAITSRGAVARLVVRRLGTPFQGQLPTLTLSVTLWSAQV
jgi:hypothetical protein